MSDLQRLIDGFDAGELVRPSTSVTGFVDVAQAVAHACGVPGISLNDHGRSLARRLARADHLIFLLADGLGIHFIDSLPRETWLRRHTERAIQAPFPSTTTTAITTLATAAYPAEHAVVGWWTYIPRIEAPVTVFYHHRVIDEVPLDELGVGMDEVSPLPSIIPRMTREAAVVLPDGIVESPYTKYMCGSAERIGYHAHADAVKAIAARLAAASGPTFTYWYTATPDVQAHELGTLDPRVHEAIADLDRALGQLDQELARIPGVSMLIGTADHGHLDVGGAGHLEVTADDPLLQHLRCPPSGDVRTLFWHVRPGSEAAFEREFAERFGRWFLLITAEEADELRLFGPEPMSKETLLRVGDYVSIATGTEVLRFTGSPGRDRYLAQRSHHSGLSSAEMLVPLIIGGHDGGAPLPVP